MGSTTRQFHFAVTHDGVALDRAAVPAAEGAGIGWIVISGGLLVRHDVLSGWKENFLTHPRTGSTLMRHRDDGPAWPKIRSEPVFRASTPPEFCTDRWVSIEVCRRVRHISMNWAALVVVPAGS